MGLDSREYNPLDEMEDLPPLNELEQLQEDYSELRKKHDKVKWIVAEFGNESPAFTIRRLKALLKITD
jgi:hypothetical protein